MPKRGSPDGINHNSRKILLLFDFPKTPRQAEKELCVLKIKLRPFVEKRLLKCLNPEARKGRFYVLTDKARKCLKVLSIKEDMDKDWKLIGWIISSPRQRLVILRTIDRKRLTSEEIRMRATQFNSHLSRTSTKNILKELGGRNLVNSEIFERLRFYRISDYGAIIRREVNVLSPISRLFSLP